MREGSRLSLTLIFFSYYFMVAKYADAVVGWESTV